MSGTARPDLLGSEGLLGLHREEEAVPSRCAVALQTRRLRLAAKVASGPAVPVVQDRPRRRPVLWAAVHNLMVGRQNPRNRKLLRRATPGRKHPALDGFSGRVRSFRIPAVADDVPRRGLEAVPVRSAEAGCLGGADEERSDRHDRHDQKSAHYARPFGELSPRTIAPTQERNSSHFRDLVVGAARSAPTRMSSTAQGEVTNGWVFEEPSV